MITSAESLDHAKNVVLLAKRLQDSTTLADNAVSIDLSVLLASAKELATTTTNYTTLLHERLSTTTPGRGGDEMNVADELLMQAADDLRDIVLQLIRAARSCAANPMDFLSRQNVQSTYKEVVRAVKETVRAVEASEEEALEQDEVAPETVRARSDSIAVDLSDLGAVDSSTDSAASSTPVAVPRSGVPLLNLSKAAAGASSDASQMPPVTPISALAASGRLAGAMSPRLKSNNALGGTVAQVRNALDDMEIALSQGDAATVARKTREVVAALVGLGDKTGKPDAKATTSSAATRLVHAVKGMRDDPKDPMSVEEFGNARAHIDATVRELYLVLNARKAKARVPSQLVAAAAITDPGDKRAEKETPPPEVRAASGSVIEKGESARDILRSISNEAATAGAAAPTTTTTETASTASAPSKTSSPAPSSPPTPLQPQVQAVVDVFTETIDGFSDLWARANPVQHRALEARVAMLLQATAPTSPADRTSSSADRPDGAEMAMRSRGNTLHSEEYLLGELGKLASVANEISAMAGIPEDVQRRLGETDGKRPKSHRRSVLASDNLSNSGNRTPKSTKSHYPKSARDLQSKEAEFEDAMSDTASAARLSGLRDLTPDADNRARRIAYARFNVEEAATIFIADMVAALKSLRSPPASATAALIGMQLALAALLDELKAPAAVKKLRTQPKDLMLIAAYSKKQLDMIGRSKTRPNTDATAVNAATKRPTDGYAICSAVLARVRVAQAELLGLLAQVVSQVDLYASQPTSVTLHAQLCATCVQAANAPLPLWSAVQTYVYISTKVLTHVPDTTRPAKPEEKTEEGAGGVFIWDAPEDPVVGNLPANDPAVVFRPGTLNGLIMRLTHSIAYDNKYMRTFLATYPSFTDAHVLWSKLMDRYEVPETTDADTRDKVRLRVCVVLKHWLETQFADFDEDLLRRLSRFLTKRLTADGMNSMAEQLRKIMVTQQRLAENDTNALQAPRSLSAPQLDMSPTDLFLYFSAAEIAGQLTLLDSKLFRAVRPVELLSLAWAKPKLRHRSPNVSAMISRANQISYWAASLVLWQDKVTERAKVYAKFTQVLDALLKLRNFNSLMGVLAGLNMSSVHRLKHTVAEAGEKAATSKSDAEQLLAPQNNFRQYRAAVHRGGSGELVPYLGVYLTDLTFIEDGNPDEVAVVDDEDADALANQVESLVKSKSGRRVTLGSTIKRSKNKLARANDSSAPASSSSAPGSSSPPSTPSPGTGHGSVRLINFKKRRLVYEVLSEIALYQQAQYKLAVVQPLETFLRNLPHESEDRLYELSLQREPRKAERSSIY
jgi:hypothetical protein